MFMTRAQHWSVLTLCLSFEGDFHTLFKMSQYIPSVQHNCLEFFGGVGGGGSYTWKEFFVSEMVDPKCFRAYLEGGVYYCNFTAFRSIQFLIFIFGQQYCLIQMALKNFLSPVKQQRNLKPHWEP